MINSEQLGAHSAWSFLLSSAVHVFIDEQSTDACLARAEALCDAITPRSDDPDPAAGDGYLSTILKAVKMDGAPPSTMNEANDYATSAAKELTIREQTAGLVSGLDHELPT